MNLFSYNRGIYEGTWPIANCTAGKDPIKDCGFNGQEGHSSNGRAACLSIEQAQEVYDFAIEQQDVDR